MQSTDFLHRAEDVWILFFDTETNGLPADYSRPASDFNNWPEMVSIAWIVYRNGRRIDAKDYIIRPDGFEISEASAKVHGITQEIALAKGVDLGPVLSKLSLMLAVTDLVIGHNIDFDRAICEASFYRLRRPAGYFGRKTFCTMKATTDFVGIAGKYKKNKWPTLSELHEKLFATGFDGAHSASADIEATAKCFWHLVRDPDLAKKAPALAGLRDRFNLK